MAKGGLMETQPVDLKSVIEEVFEVTIGKADASSISTPSDLVGFLASRLSDANGAVTFSAVTAFLQLRRAAAEILGISPSHFRASTTWDDVLPKENPGRRQAWMELQKIANVSLPGLTGKKWPWLFLDLAVIPVAPFLYSWLGGLTGVFWGLVTIAVSAAVSALMVRNLAMQPPHRTIGDSARHVAASRSSGSNSAAIGWKREQIAPIVRVLVEDELEGKEFSEGTPFRDMGIDLLASHRDSAPPGLPL
jgi:hypothetical protein